MKVRRPTLGGRLALAIFVGQALLLSALAVLVYQSAERVVRASFDRSLRSNAEALAALVEPEPDAESGFEVEIDAAAVTGLLREHEPDLFAVVADGEVLAKSDELDEIPEFEDEDDDDPVFVDYRNDDTKYRGVALTLVRGNPEEPGLEREATVFFSSSMSRTKHQLGQLRVAIAVLCGVCVVLSALLARVVAAFGMRPLARLAKSIAGVRGDGSDARLASEELHAELLPIAESTNGLLGRIETALEKERRFGADAAHELRTPVATLKSGLEAALLDASPDRDPAEVFEAQLAEVRRLESLCDALLLLTAGGARGDETLSMRDWIAEIEAAVDAVRTACPSAAPRIVVAIPEVGDDGVLVRADAPSTFRIATNLVGNAARHAGDSAAIRVSVERTERDARVIIEDDGVGIPADARGQLFERFHRVEKSRSRELGGCGLGLAICRTLARSFGGDATFEPNAPQGSRFIWTTPTVRSDRSAS